MEATVRSNFPTSRHFPSLPGTRAFGLLPTSLPLREEVEGSPVRKVIKVGGQGSEVEALSASQWHCGCGGLSDARSPAQAASWWARVLRSCDSERDELSRESFAKRRNSDRFDAFENCATSRARIALRARRQQVHRSVIDVLHAHKVHRTPCGNYVLLRTDFAIVGQPGGIPCAREPHRLRPKGRHEKASHR